MKITELAEMKAIVFVGFSPDPEMKAFGKMSEWLKNNRPGSYRIFGYNTGLDGKLSLDPQNEGYRILLVINDEGIDFTGLQSEVIGPGKFLVMRTGGRLEDVEQWMPEGWKNLNRTVLAENLKVKDPVRWFEEHIITSDPEYLTVDLYLELQ